MTQKKLLADLSVPREEDYLNCIRCGLCLSVCPLYRANLTETAGPRGHVALTRKVLDGDLEPSENLFENMYGCFGCLACNEICPVGIKPADLALAMRHVQEQLHASPWKRVLFNHVLSHPARLERVTWPLRLYQRLGVRRLYYALGLGRLMPSKMRDLEAMLPRLPQRPLRRVLPEKTEAVGSVRYRVGFFLGCAQSLLFTEESAATVEVLSCNGCHVVTPRDVKCCGMPAIGYGRRDILLEMAKHNVGLFEKYNLDVIVTDCATCGSTLKEYGEILSEDSEWSARARAFSDKVRDISEFLADIRLRRPGSRMDIRVTYHDPCHLRRAQGVWEAPRNLIQLIDGIEFVELKEADWCCGSAGSQLITHYETSRKVLERKMDNLDETGAQVVASGCPGCQMQLQVGIRDRGLAMEVTHPVLLLARAYRDGRQHGK
jgi:glycolate oxidase iron-sulfur subunit